MPNEQNTRDTDEINDEVVGRADEPDEEFDDADEPDAADEVDEDVDED